MTKKQLKAEKLVEKHIIQNINLTMEKAFEENPEILFEAKNYKEDKETGEYPEIYEWWSVSDWLADKLENRGEIVFEYLDFKVWGRQTTGQAIKLDNIIQEIAEEYNS